MCTQVCECERVWGVGGCMNVSVCQSVCVTV